jgi:hypothetical protein
MHFSFLVASDDPESELEPFVMQENVLLPQREDWPGDFDKADAARLGLQHDERGWYRIESHPQPYKFDWAAIGGRFSGVLIPKPGAISGRVAGETLPSFEADLVTSLAAHEDLRISLPSIERGSGFDQLRKGEVDLPITLEQYTPNAVLIIGEWHEASSEALFDDEQFAVWRAQVRRLLEEVPENILLTVFDAHH